MARKIAYWLALAILAFTGVIGIYNAINEWSDQVNAFQKSVMIGVLGYGVLGLLATYALLTGRHWASYAAIAWGVAVTYVPGAAVMAYGGEDAGLASAIAASLASALIAAGVVSVVADRLRAKL